jgi:hypothetical protein
MRSTDARGGEAEEYDETAAPNVNVSDLPAAATSRVATVVSLCRTWRSPIRAATPDVIVWAAMQHGVKAAITPVPGSGARS